MEWDESLYADFRKGSRALLAQSENTLKHWAGGTAGTSQMASKGPILDVTKTKGEIPLGSSGIQIDFETDLITEGIRPGRIVRIRPANWPDIHVPREEYLKDSSATHEDRFPTPAIFRYTDAEVNQLTISGRMPVLSPWRSTLTPTRRSRVSQALHNGVSFGATMFSPSLIPAPPPVRRVGQLVSSCPVRMLLP